MCWKTNKVNEQIDPATARWQEASSASCRNLILKKVAVSIIALANCAGLGVALYYIVSYCPIPTQAILVSPFIVGALGALKNMKIPTLGFTASNYKSDLNPTTIVGKVVAYIFFGPLMLAVNNIDWIPYHDSIRARAISDDLEKKEFAEISKEYGNHLSNLFAYKFIPKNNNTLEIYAMHEECKAEEMAVEFWTKERNPDNVTKAQENIQKINEKWNRLRDWQIKNELPKPEVPKYDFSKWTHRFKKAWRDFCFKPATAVPN